MKTPKARASPKTRRNRAVAVLAATLVMIACGGGTDTPLDPPGQPFEIEIRDVSWEGRVFGLIDTDPASADTAGRCIALLGKIRPTFLVGVVSNGIHVPSIGLSAAGTQLDEARTVSCDIADLTAAGYGPIREARVTVGTTYPFYRVFYLPAGTAALEGTLVGIIADPTRRSHVAEGFEPVLLDSIPHPGPSAPSPIKKNHTLLPVGAGFTYPEGRTPWEGMILGLIYSERVPIPQPFAAGADTAEPGRCALILGRLGLAGITEATAAGSPTMPSFGLIVDGKLLQFGRKLERCDITEPVFAGFGPLNRFATDTTGGSYPFYQRVFVPGDEPSAPEAVAVRYPWSKDQWFLFEPAVLPRVPDPRMGAVRLLSSPTILPVGDPARSTFRNGFGVSGQANSVTTISRVEWEGLILGLAHIPTNSEIGDTPHCLAVLGALTLTRFEGFDLPEPPLRPDIGLMIDGRRSEPSSLERCDTSGLDNAGYVRFGDTGTSVGAVESFYEAFALTSDQLGSIQAVVVSTAWFYDFRFFQPTILGTIPAA